MARKQGQPRARHKEPRPAPVRQELMDEATDALYSAFRLPVKVHWASRGGRVEIDFSKEEQLRSLIDALEHL